MTLDRQTLAWLQLASDRPDADPPSLPDPPFADRADLRAARARAAEGHLELGFHALDQRRHEDLRQHLAAAQHRVHGDAQRAHYFELAGALALHDGDAARAVDSYRQLLHHERRAGEDAEGIASTWHKLADALSHAGQHAEAERTFEQAVRRATRAGMAPLFLARIHWDFARMQERAGAHVRAITQWAQAVLLMEDCYGPDQRAIAAFRLGSAMARVPHFAERAPTQLRRALSLSEGLPDCEAFRADVQAALERLTS